MNARWKKKIAMGRAPCHAMGRFGARWNLPFGLVWEDFQLPCFPSHPLVLMCHSYTSPRSWDHLP
ncbi:phorbol-12-myristate-13-acetate-induced protein 1, partial [Columba livia]